MDLQSPAILTLEQIRQRHDGEWVLIAYTEIDRKNLPIVVAHVNMSCKLRRKIDDYCPSLE